MRMTFSRSKTKILPSPIFPVLADRSIASMACSRSSVLTAASTFTFGRKSTTYSAPRYSSVWPFCRPKPFTSVTVMPCTPIADSASRTSSSLNGLMMAVTSFMVSPQLRGGVCTAAARSESSERLLDVGHELALPGVPAEAIGVGQGLRVRARAVDADGHAHDLGERADLPVAVVVEAVVLELLLAIVGEHVDLADRVVHLVDDVVRGVDLPVVGTLRIGEA